MLNTSAEYLAALRQIFLMPGFSIQHVGVGAQARAGLVLSTADATVMKKPSLCGFIEVSHFPEAWHILRVLDRKALQTNKLVQVMRDARPRCTSFDSGLKVIHS
jgi:hypothetical protein